MKKVYDAVCVVGEYKKGNETKKKYLVVGAVLENDQGQMSLKLDAMPTNFNGWINFYEPKEQKDQKKPFDDSDGIPF